MRSIGALRTVGRSLCVRALGYEAANMSPQTVWEASTSCAWESSRFMPRFQFDRSTLDTKMPINQIAVSHRPHFQHRVDFDLCTGGEGFPLVIAETEVCDNGGVHASVLLLCVAVHSCSCSCYSATSTTSPSLTTRLMACVSKIVTCPLMRSPPPISHSS